MKIVLIIAAVFVVLMSQVFAEPTLEFEGRYCITDLQAETRVTSGVLIGTHIDLRDDLGIGNENYPEARFIWHTGPNSKIRLAYTQVTYSGNKNIEKDIHFNGRTYNAGTNVETDLDIQYFRLGWAWQFINMFEEKLKLGPFLDAKGFIFDVSLDAPSQGISESEEFMIALPTVGAVLDYNLGEKIKLFAEVSGLPSADYGHIFDAELGIEFIPFENFSIDLGYRVIDMELEDDPNYGEFRITGPFFGGTVRF